MTLNVKSKFKVFYWLPNAAGEMEALKSSIEDLKTYYFSTINFQPKLKRLLVPL